MAFVAAPNCVELAVICSQDNQPVENTYHYRLPAPASYGNLQTLVHAAVVYWSAANDAWPTNVGLIKVYARALDTPASPSYEENPATTIDGTKTGQALPNDVTFAHTRYTGLAGRAQRGRVYWIGITDTDLSGANTIDSGRVGSQRNKLLAFKTAMAALTPSAVEILLHRADGTHNDVIGYRWADLFLDNQRRRLPAHNVHR